jgi:hypothetical protein
MEDVLGEFLTAFRYTPQLRAIAARRIRQIAADPPNRAHPASASPLASACRRRIMKCDWRIVMPSDPSIEQRLSAVEKAVAEIQRRLDVEHPTPNWIERFTGAFKDEPAFAEVVAYGRELRSADRPDKDNGA